MNPAEQLKQLDRKGSIAAKRKDADIVILNENNNIVMTFSVVNWHTKRRKIKVNIIRAKDYNEMSLKAAEMVIKKVQENPNTKLGLATGGTPVGMYKELIKYHQQKRDFLSKGYVF